MLGFYVHLVLEPKKTERYGDKTWCQHSEAPLVNILGVLENLVKNKICPISFTIYYIHIIRMLGFYVHLVLEPKKTERYGDKTWCQHSEAPLVNILGVLENLVKNKICPISFTIYYIHIIRMLGFYVRLIWCMLEYRLYFHNPMQITCYNILKMIWTILTQSYNPVYASSLMNFNCIMHGKTGFHGHKIQQYIRCNT